MTDELNAVFAKDLSGSSVAEDLRISLISKDIRVMKLMASGFCYDEFSGTFYGREQNIFNSMANGVLCRNTS